MKKTLLPIAVLLFVIFACRGSAPSADESGTVTESPTADQSPASLTPFQDGDFAVRYPDWPQDTDSAGEGLVAVAQGGYGVWIARHETFPRFVVDALRQQIASRSGASLLADSQRDGHPLLEYTLPLGEASLHYQTLFVYCQLGTYTVAVAGLEGTVEDRADLLDAVLDSARCDDPFPSPDLETGKLGMGISPANDDPSNLYQAVRLAKRAGAQITRWAQIEHSPGEYNWDTLDYFISLYHNEGLEISLVFDVIHTTVRGDVPADLSGRPFDDPEFIQRFTDLALALLDRHPDTIQYLGVGNEVNDYFNGHRDEIPAYRTFFLAVRNAIAARHPEVQVAMTFAYHDVERQGSQDLVEALNLGDFVPYTLYLYSGEFEFDRDPAELERNIEGMLDLAGDKPIAIVELGWNTADLLGGSQEDQAAFVRESFRLLPRYRDRIAFVSWYTLHDAQPEHCRESALTFIPPGSGIEENQAFMERFTAFLCHLGLRQNDGTPKLGWEAYLEESSSYLQTAPE